MAEAQVAGNATTPSISRLFDAVPLAPTAVGIAITAGLVAIFFGVEWATGQIASVRAGSAEEHIPLHFRVNTVNAVLMGFLPTALYYLERWRRANHTELLPLLRTAAPLPSPSPTVSRAIGLASAVALILGFLVLPYGIDLFATREYWIFEHVWDWLTLPPLAWLVGCFAYTLIFDSIALSRLASRIRSIDLLDSRSLIPFVRQGLRAALLVVLFLSIGIAHVGNAIVELGTLRAFPAIFLMLAGAALVVPVWGAHKRIREEKAAELARVRARIADGRAALEGEGEAAERAARRLPAWLALEARTTAVREWPFDASSLIRFGLYLGLGLGSWLGAAAAERLFDYWLS